MHRTALLLSVPAVVVTALALAGGTASAGSGTQTLSGSRAGCSVEITIGTSYATAAPGAGCTGGDYWFSSWQIPSESDPANTPQQLLSTTNRSPWTVPLPTGAPCFYQVDFARRSAPPSRTATSRTLILAHVGQTPSCQSTTTTTDPVPTTGPTTVPVASSTTVPVSTGTTVPLVVPTTAPGRTASATGTTMPAAAAGTSTTSTVRLAVNGGQPPVAAATPSAATRTSSGNLAFTGFAVLMALFAAGVLITAGVGLVRASRDARRVPVESGSPFDPPGP